MPYRFDFDSTHQVLRGQLEGRVSDQELVEFFKEIKREWARLSPQAGVADCSGLTALEVNAQTVRTLAKTPPEDSDAEKPRFIVAPAPDVFGLARLFQFEGEAARPNLHVVRSLREVCVIMGVQKLFFEPLPSY